MPQTQVAWSIESIGETAGRVWEYLRRSGKTSVSDIEKRIDVPTTLTHLSIGWLAREGKLAVRPEGRSVQVWLTE